MNKTKTAEENSSVVLCARQFGGALVIDDEAPSVVMFAPGGRHTISPAVMGSAGKASAVVTLLIDASTAAVLQASLDYLNSSHAPQKALFDKNHEGREAMAWPTRFEWRDSPQPGVYASVEWSKLGRDYVTGKVLRAFSGQFFCDAELPKPKAVRAGQTYSLAAGKRGSPENPARIEGLDFPYAGTLTNDPAFREILPLFAENQAENPYAADIRLHEAATMNFRCVAGEKAGA